MKYIYFLVILLSINAFGQERKNLKLRIMIDELSVFPLKVLNTTTEETVTTDSAGFFSMKVKANDELVLVENDYYQLKYTLKHADLVHNIVRVYPESKNTVLKEVEVKTITTNSLGIDNKTIMTNYINPNPNLNMDLLAIFSWITGKTKKEKQRKNEIVLRKSYEQNPYVAQLPRTVITDYLKIPDSLVHKFYYYMNDDYLIDQYIKQGDDAKCKMHLLYKSFDFLQQEKDETEE